MTASWRLVDFHVHTPLSRCHEPGDWDAAAFLAAAEQAGLDAVVVSDHHTSENAWLLLDEAHRRRSVEVIPGMEVTTPQGHLLVLFDATKPRETWRQFATDIGLPEAHYGNGSRSVAPAMDEVITIAAGHGALPVPAHIDRWPNGFMERGLDYRARAAIHGHSEISAVEITLPETKAAWESGGVPPFSRALACVRGSDAHALTEVGRRPTWVNTASLALQDLRAAFVAGCGTSFRDPRREEHTV